MDKIDVLLSRAATATEGMRVARMAVRAAIKINGFTRGMVFLGFVILTRYIYYSVLAQPDDTALISFHA